MNYLSTRLTLVDSRSSLVESTFASNFAVINNNKHTLEAKQIMHVLTPYYRFQIYGSS